MINQGIIKSCLMTHYTSIKKMKPFTSATGNTFNRILLIVLLLNVGNFTTAFAIQLPDQVQTDYTETNREDLPPGWEYQSNTENPHGVIIVLGANPRINDIPINYGDYIGAFYEDDNGDLKCGGADFWTGTENIIFAVFGDDTSTPEKDGFGFNETMHFKIYYQDNFKAYDVTSISWDPEYYGTNTWSPLGLSAATDVQCEVDFDAYATVDANPICIGQSINLEGHIFIETTGNYTWQWTSTPPGLNSTSQTASHTPNVTTTYFLEVSDGTNNSTHEFFVTVFDEPMVDAGDNITICIDQPAFVEATMTNSSGVVWSTTGDGTFENAGSLSTWYYPGTQDQQNLEVTLSLTAFPLDPCQTVAADNKSVAMQPNAAVSLPAEYEFCESQDMIMEAEGNLFDEVMWETNGDGSFSEPNALTTQYFPGTSDLNTNEFELTVTVSSLNPCTNMVSAQTLVSTHDLATLAAPSTKTVCEDAAVNLNSIASNYSALMWTTSGDGTFLNPEMLSTTYFPGPEDIAGGGTMVTIHAFGTGICQDYDVKKDIQVILLPNPEANAGPNGEVCQQGSYQLQGSASNTSFVLWTSLGDGYFSNPYVENPVYYPGTNDNNSESFKLFISGYAVYPCTVPATDTISISVLPEPTVEIGSNQASVCHGDDYVFSETEAENYADLEWFTINGTGMFDDNTLLNPTYTPDPEHDYALGSIIIGVTAWPIDPCTNPSDDFFTLYFEAPPIVDAGANDTITESETFIPNPEADNYGSILWETSGDGTFINPESLFPEYFPGFNDIANYGTTLTITAQPEEACEVSATDMLELTILKNQIINMYAGENSFSSYINFDGKSFEEIFEPVSPNLIFVQQSLQIYWPEYNINTVEDFSNMTGLRLILDEDADWQLSGFEISDKTITLKSGWNLIPVLSSCPVSPQQIDDLLGEDLIIITEVESNSFYQPENSGNTLGQIVPGKSYWIKVATPQTFSFPGCN